MLRGLQELRFEQAIITYLRSKDSHEAAKVAGLSRARFLDILIDQGVRVLEEPSTVREEVSFLAKALDAERLRSALQTVGAPLPDDRAVTFCLGPRPFVRLAEADDRSPSGHKRGYVLR